MAVILWIFPVLLTVALGAPEAAAGAAGGLGSRRPECPAAGTEPVTLSEVIDGSSFQLAGGAIVRLAGVLAPGQDGATLSAAGTEAGREALRRVLESGPLALAPGGGLDRYGRRRAQVFAGGVWVQGALLRAGAVRAAPELSEAPCAGALLAAENGARARRAGHWGDGRFSIRAPEGLSRFAGTFQVVEGLVLAATVYRGRAYLNFGPDYRTDFTVTVAPPDMRSFRAARLDPRSFSGRRIRVRGWVEIYNGPEMQIAAPAAIEPLD